jgi:glutathione S-transferase
MACVLYIGNKNASSWSLRAWLALREKGVPFEERVIDLFGPDRGPTLARVAPSSQVPVLHHDDLVVFDSLAIMEYANDGFDGPPLLPADPRGRARARSLLAWMHSGFHELRKGMSFEGTFHKNPVAAPDAALREAARLAETWERELTRSDGPYLLGPLSLADLTFVPVIRRLRAHGFPLPRYPRASIWATELMTRPSVREWMSVAESLPPVGT